jgi:hypothetical protein
VLIPAEGTSGNDGVAQSAAGSLLGMRPKVRDPPSKDKRIIVCRPAPAATYRAASRVRPVRTDRAGAASLKTGTGPGDVPSCAVAVVTYVKPIQPWASLHA